MIGRCRVRYGINGHVRCSQLGVFGRCLDHWLDLVRWERAWRYVVVRLDLGSLNRPIVRVDEERPRKWISFEYGNGNSDPVVMLELRRDRP